MSEKLNVREFDKTKLTPSNDKTQLTQPLPEKLDLEIGCGVGYHPIQYCKTHPERTLIAIEHTTEKFNKFARRLSNHPELKNVFAIHADAVRWVSLNISECSIDNVFILYPNPEPKSANKRWVRAPFFHELLKKIKSGGTITIATNIEEYASEAELYLKKYWKLICVESSTINVSNNPSYRPRTHFEKKYLSSGQTCFNLVYKKP